MQSIDLKSGKPLTGGVSIYYWLYLLPTLLDYRFDRAGPLVVMLQAVPFILSMVGAAGCIIRAGGVVSLRSYVLIPAATAIFLIVSITVGLFDGQPLADLAKSSVAFIEFGVALLVVGSLNAAGFDRGQIISRIVSIALVLTLSNFFMVLAFNHISFESVRFQVLSGAAPFVTAYVVNAMVNGGLRPWQIPFVLGHIFVVLVSVTRTQLLIFAVVIAASFLGSRAQNFFGRRAYVTSIIVITSSLIGLSAMSLLPGDQLSRWYFRLFASQSEHGLDLTALTRNGEIDFQVSHWLSSFSRFLFGFGLQGEINASADALTQILRFYSGEDLLAKGMGHNMLASLFYCGGFLGSIILVIALLKLLLDAILVQLRAAKSLPPGVMDRYLNLGPLSLIGLTVICHLSDPFMYRQSALFFGLSAGLAILSSELYRDSRKQYRSLMLEISSAKING